MLYQVVIDNGDQAAVTSVTASIWIQCVTQLQDVWSVLMDLQEEIAVMIWMSVLLQLIFVAAMQTAPTL